MKINATFIYLLLLCTLAGCGENFDTKENYVVQNRPAVSLDGINQSLKKINQALDRIVDLLEKNK